ncbi:MAG: Trk system potassium transporter TrkA [Solobacterium sp.]|nr:Trk system potassium transporter TrkA [Solobacterium sp.]
MKILVAGSGKVGSEIVEKLSAEGHELTIIDNDTDVLESIMENYDVIGVRGNAASLDVLEEAGARDTDLLIAVTDMDEVNLLACMTARSINEDIKTIARIRNPDYRSQAVRMRSLFGLDMSINPEENAAVEIKRLLQYPGFLNIDTFARGNAEIVTLRIDENSQLKNVKLNDLDHIVHTTVLVALVERSGRCIIPDGDFVLQENDRIHVTASTNNLSVLLRNLGILTRRVKDVLIAGGSTIGYYLARELEDTGIRATIIEKKPSRCNELATLLPKARIILGDASSQQFLESENLGSFDALITLTGLDELNIVISLFGQACGVPTIITKMSHAENNRMLDSLPIGSVISSKEMISSTIVRYVRSIQNTKGAALTVHMFGNGTAEAIEFDVDDETRHCGEELKDIHVKHGVLIAGITRGLETEIPSGSSRFQPGDTLVIVAGSDLKIRELNDIFED